MNEDRTYIVTFTDFVYAALLAYALDKLDRAFSSPSISIGFVSFAIVLMIYDWYGTHSLATHRRIGLTSISHDFISIGLYFGLVITGAESSIYFLLLMGLRGLNGVIFNCMLLRAPGNAYRRERLKSYNLSSSFMLIGFLLLFVVDTFLEVFSSLDRFIISIALWTIAYAVALIAESIYSAAVWWQQLKDIANSITELIREIVRRLILYGHGVKDKILSGASSLKRYAEQVKIRTLDLFKKNK